MSPAASQAPRMSGKYGWVIWWRTKDAAREVSSWAFRHTMKLLIACLVGRGSRGWEANMRAEFKKTRRLK